jgi:hypothetical protein
MMSRSVPCVTTVTTLRRPLARAGEFTADAEYRKDWHRKIKQRFAATQSRSIALLIIGGFPEQFLPVADL